jgi:hypothetical protein
MVGRAQKLHGMRSGLYGGCSNGVPPINIFQAKHRIQFDIKIQKGCNNMKNVFGRCVLCFHPSSALISPPKTSKRLFLSHSVFILFWEHEDYKLFIPRCYFNTWKR